ncbi:MAG: NAD(P)-binding domain-containing protein, partial [Desulfobacterales bacterium]
MKVKNEIDPTTFKIAVVGAGSWGTAIADLLACKGFKISLWVFEKDVREQIEQFQENKLFLPGHTLSTNISPSNDLAAVVANKNLIVTVVPSHLMRAMTNKMSGDLSQGAVIVSASKGIE